MKRQNQDMLLQPVTETENYNEESDKENMDIAVYDDLEIENPSTTTSMYKSNSVGCQIDIKKKKRSARVQTCSKSVDKACQTPKIKMKSIGVQCSFVTSSSKETIQKRNEAVDNVTSTDESDENMSSDSEDSESSDFDLSQAVDDSDTDSLTSEEDRSKKEPRTFMVYEDQLLKLGLIRSIDSFNATNIKIKTLVTDRHLQVAKWVRENLTDTKHCIDVWHVAKGLKKKLTALSKEKGCEEIQPLIKSISNHLYWVAASTPSADGKLMTEKWQSVQNHIQNIHKGHGELFPKCCHDKLIGRERKKPWRIAGTKVCEKFQDIVTSRQIRKDVPMLSTGQQTSSLESYHVVVNHFAPKMIGFSYHEYTEKLKTMVIESANLLPSGATSNILPIAPPPLCSNYTRPDKEKSVLEIH